MGAEAKQVEATQVIWPTESPDASPVIGEAVLQAPPSA